MGLKVEGDVIIVQSDDGKEYRALIDDTLRNKIMCLIGIPSMSVVTHSTDNYTMFFGPYIDGSDTGYIIQVIDRITRNCYNIRYRFGERHLEDIKQELAEIFM